MIRVSNLNEDREERSFSNFVASMIVVGLTAAGVGFAVYTGSFWVGVGIVGVLMVISAAITDAANDIVKAIRRKSE